MSKLKRIFDDQSQYYFVTTKTYKGDKIFDDRQKVGLLLQCLNYLVEKEYFKLFAWVILPNHLHILLEIAGKKNISEIMHDFKSYTANQISKLLLNHKNGRGAEASTTRGIVKGRETLTTMDNKYGFVGEASRPCPEVVKIWQTSFYDHIIRNQKDFNAHLDYIHFNPVKHGYATKPEDWTWSSYNSFLKNGYYEKGWGHGTIPNNVSRLCLE